LIKFVLKITRNGVEYLGMNLSSVNLTVGKYGDFESIQRSPLPTENSQSFFVIV
jgi:hypothetical protein